ncbi:MAG: transposase zinc-binding domain-containing protein [Syntrophales bacterium]
MNSKCNKYYLFYLVLPEVHKSFNSRKCETSTHSQQAVCGNLHDDFARVKCKDCGHEYLLSFSCKGCHFCPSCHQKRVVESEEWRCMDVLRNVPLLEKGES